MGEKIKRSRCPWCKQTRPSYLIASHITQCQNEAEEAMLTRKLLFTLMQLGTSLEDTQ
ncbi:hypothetical protein LCGC14_1381940 [marine sediment metagenome]|uniref:Uncharacterized protein n=1 Tax=marine sediment metagenome TaxID=412755 RepID=A0A0F9MHU1_9ZZZZ